MPSNASFDRDDRGDGNDATHDVTELLDAIAQGRLATAKELLAGGADPNASDESGWLPLLMAAIVGPRDLVAALLEAGVDVNARGPDGSTALMKATLWRQGEIVRLLLANGADPHAADDRGWTAASIAAHLGDRELGALLSAASRTEGSRDGRSDGGRG